MNGKRMISALLALVLTLALAPICIANAAAYRAKNLRTGDQYTKIQDAIDAAQSGDTIKVLDPQENIYELLTIPAGLSLTIDLDGNTIFNNYNNGSHTEAVGDIITNYGTLLLKNGSLHPYHNHWFAVMNCPGGNMTIENVTINGGSAANQYMVKNLGTMTINAGTSITKNHVHGVPTIENGWYTGGESDDYNRNIAHEAGQIATMTINAGTFASTLGGSVLRNYAYGEIEVNGGTYTSETGFECLLNYDKATINGGTFVSRENIVLRNKSSVEWEGMRGEVTINGGTFRAAYDGLISNVVYEPDSADTVGVLTITGGVFEREDSNIGSLLVSYGTKVVGTETDPDTGDIEYVYGNEKAGKVFITGGIFKGSINAECNAYTTIEAKKTSDDPYSGPFFNVPVKQDYVIAGQHCTTDRKKTAPDGHDYYYLEDDGALVTLNDLLYGYNLKLEDSILINERIYFPVDSTYDITKFSVTYFYGGVTNTVALNASMRVLENEPVNSRYYNVYQVQVADCFAKQMTDETVITFAYDGVPIKNTAGTGPRQYVVSIRSYCESVIDDPTKDDNLVNLCKAVLTYGAYAQLRFNYKPDDLAVRDWKYATDDPSTAIPSAWGPRASVGSCEAVLGVSISLVLESKTHLNFYVHPAEGHTAEEIYDLISVTFESASVTNYTKTIVTEGEKAGTVLVQIHGIMAKNLGSIYAVSVGNETLGVRTWYHSPINYAYNAQTQAPNEKQIMLALYDYFQAAAKYLD